MSHRSSTQRQQLSIVYGILCIVLILVTMQLWLLTATMNAYLGGNHAIVWPAAFASLACLALNVGLLRYLSRLESPDTASDNDALSQSTTDNDSHRFNAPSTTTGSGT